MTPINQLQAVRAILERYQHMDDGVAQLLAGFKSRPETIDDKSLARHGIALLDSVMKEMGEEAAKRKMINQQNKENNMSDNTQLYNALMKLNDRFQSTMNWSPEATDHEKTLVKGNLNGFCGFLAKQMPLEVAGLNEDESHATVDEL